MKRSTEIVKKMRECKATVSEQTKIKAAHESSRKNFESLMEVRIHRLLEKYSHHSSKSPIKNQRDIFMSNEEKLSTQRRERAISQSHKAHQLQNKISLKALKVDNNLEMIKEERRKYYDSKEYQKELFLNRYRKMSEENIQSKKSIIEKQIRCSESVKEIYNKRKQFLELAKEHSLIIRSQISKLLNST